MKYSGTLLLFAWATVVATAQPRDPAEFSTDELAVRAKNRIRVLEQTIQRVIEYGQSGTDAQQYIRKVVLADFMTGATIQTASVSRAGKVFFNPAIPYEHYFTNLWNRARTTPSLKVYFSDVQVTKIDRYRYRVTVQIVQEYESQRYSDTTVKEIEIHFIPRNGAFVEKIGSARVTDIWRK